MEVYIADAVRTPRGKAKPDGGLAELSPHGLATTLIDALEERSGIGRENVERLSLGCVGQVGAQGGHLALTTKIAARLPEGTVTHTLNNFCVSGLTAIAESANAIAAGQAGLALAGGVEMMSQVPFMADKADYYTAREFAARDQYIPVVLAAERLSVRENIDRATMDRAAIASQGRAAAAESDDALNASRIAQPSLDRDETIRPIDAEKAAALAPAFAAMGEQYAEPLDGEALDYRMTVAHAPPMADGAGIAMLGTREQVANPRARIVAFAEAGGDVRDSLLGGFAAMERALEKADLSLADMDRIEFMEAFAVTIAKLERDYAVDMDKVNVGGGHLAKGHPMGATGAILLSALLDALDACEGRHGLVVTTGAQGVGAAMIVERLAR
ncbi:acetyl-CoA C-acyltransferase [Pelagerythrobacter marensis]|uniref:Acyl-CoA thiolase n=1 Tax=Pelagerythrobacter marensis TaxID=543877 RepID=A0A0G3XDD9_9SPHN|nr:acetyl-CoA C-acyltransferase [Pelagerythrobacter marensis]AKM08641.1 acyl-CoA thiolase [Pelagerythrobacter marensis]